MEAAKPMVQMGKYQLIRRLGRGGMAEVFLAKAAGPMGFEKTLVVKRILPHLMEEQQFVDMFLSEARLAAQLNHANVVQIFDFGVEDDSYFIAMEHIDGPSLHALIKRAYTEQKPIAFPLCAKIISFVCEGLAYAHELADPTTDKPLGLIHRDISSDNILLSRNGGVKVVDFGIAKLANQQHRTQTGLVRGKVAYMSPEHLKGRPLDHRADVFALGVVLYALVTGCRPFEGESDVALAQAILNTPMADVGEHRRGVPKALERILEKALAKEREQRYRSCREFQEDLERFLLQTGEPVGPAQIAELVKKLAPPEPASSTTLTTPASPPASMAAPPAELGSTKVLSPMRQAPTTPLEASPAPQEKAAPAAPAGSRARLGWMAGSLIVSILVGAGGYLGLRGRQQTPEQVNGGGTVKPEPPSLPPVKAAETAPEAPAAPQAPREPPAVAAAPAPQVREPVAEKPLAPTPEPHEETAALASFQVTSKPAGMVSVNGKRVGKSPVEIKIEPGKVNVAVEGDDDGERFATSQTVVVKPGANPLVSLAPKRLKITVRGRPRDFAVQWVDDLHFLGGSAGPLEVYEGWHTLKLTDPAGKSHTARCQARPGDDLCLFEVKDDSP